MTSALPENRLYRRCRIARKGGHSDYPQPPAPRQEGVNASLRTSPAFSSPTACGSTAHAFQADPTLQARCHQCIASRHPLKDANDGVATVIKAMGRVSGPVILVGHSYGGTLITAARTDDRVAGLVYMSALVPDETETSQQQQDKFADTEAFEQIEIADEGVWLRPEGIE